VYTLQHPWLDKPRSSGMHSHRGCEQGSRHPPYVRLETERLDSGDETLHLVQWCARHRHVGGDVPPPPRQYLLRSIQVDICICGYNVPSIPRTWPLSRIDGDGTV
jgi:hypothetical protein